MKLAFPTAPTAPAARKKIEEERQTRRADTGSRSVSIRLLDLAGLGLALVRLHHLADDLAGLLGIGDPEYFCKMIRAPHTSIEDIEPRVEIRIMIRGIIEKDPDTNRIGNTVFERCPKRKPLVIRA